MRSKLYAIALLAAALATFASPARAEPALFDKPLKLVHVPLPRDRDNPQSRPGLSCVYYTHFMVKQIDLGEEGADQLSIIPVAAKSPECRRENIAGENVVSPDDWTGYFSGVKAGYVFFDAEDGWNGGMGFAVFTADGKKVFDDAEEKWLALTPAPSGLTVRYRRVFAAKCSLYAGNTGACWQQIRHDTGLSGPAPDCAAAYGREQKRTPKFAQQVLTDPTVITYEVSVAVHARAYKFTPVTGKAIVCRPAD